MALTENARDKFRKVFWVVIIALIMAAYLETVSQLYFLSKYKQR